MKNSNIILITILILSILINGISLFSMKPEIVTQLSMKKFCIDNCNLINKIIVNIKKAEHQKNIIYCGFQEANHQITFYTYDNNACFSYEDLFDDNILNESIQECFNKLKKSLNSKYKENEYVLNISHFSHSMYGDVIDISIFNVNYRVDYGVYYSTNDLSDELIPLSENIYYYTFGRV